MSDYSESDYDVETLDICSECFNAFSNSTSHVCLKQKEVSQQPKYNENISKENSVLVNIKQNNDKLVAKNAVPLTENITNPVINGAWTDENTAFMLERYHQYMEEIGPMKKFRNKKAMWAKIKLDIEKEYNYSFNETQIENRYKTVLKRNKTVAKNNNTTGSSPKYSTVDDEFTKITALDDSIEPAVQVGTSSSGLKRIVKEDNVSNDRVPKIKKKVKTSIPDVLLAIHKEKEESRRQRELDRQKRHDEKMEILRSLLNNN